MLYRGRRTDKRLLHEFAIAGAVRLGIAETLALVLFVFGIETFKEENFGVALKGQNVSTDAVEEPTVVRYDDGTTGKVFQDPLPGHAGY